MELNKQTDSRVVSQSAEADTLRRQNSILNTYDELGWDNIAPADKAFVENLAKSCLYTHGLGVFTARMLWSNAEPDFDFDDLVLCSSGTNKTDPFATVKEYLSSNEGANEEELFGGIHAEAKVYPNPTTGILNIFMNTTEESEFILYNMLGAVVFNTKLNTKTSQHSITLPAYLANGMYHYKIGSIGNKNVQGKINLIR